MTEQKKILINCETMSKERKKERTFLKNKGASKGSSSDGRRTIFGSTKNLSVKGSLKNHLFFTFLIIWRTFFHYKEASMASWSTFVF